MRSNFIGLIAGIAITAISALAADNSIGTWKLNMEKSKFSTPFPMKNLTSTFEASEGGVKVVNSGERPDGSPVQGGYTVKYDGKDYPAAGAPFNTIAMKQVSANVFTFKLKNTGTKFTSTGRSVISKDGRTMTGTSKGTGADGKPFQSTMVWDKQ
jgi:hypothetical protein